MGPTACGKSSLAMKLADRIPAEILSTDSMQVYQRMNIGTAKPSDKAREKVKHHMIDILDIRDRIDIYFYVEKAKAAIKDILSKKKIPVLAGGSGLYIKSILYGLDPLPSDPELRLQLVNRYTDKNEELREQVKKTDILAYRKFKDNPRKLLRALEVFNITGKSITLQQEQWNKQELKFNVNSYNIQIDRKTLFKNITLRTEQMLRKGWIDETERLVKNGLLETPTARQAIGYFIIAEYLNGRITYEQMEARIISSTKKYARRQETWFRHQHPETVNLSQGTDYLKKIINDFEKSSELSNSE